MCRTVNYSRTRKLYAGLSFPTKVSVVFCLHVQPEEAIDVACHDFRNQLECCFKLKSVLPDEMALIVRVHPHSLNQISRDDLYSLMKRDINICPPRLSLDEVIKERTVLAVGSIGGFAPVEGELKGKPGFHLQYNYLSQLLSGPTVSRDGWDSLSAWFLEIKEMGGRECFSTDRLVSLDSLLACVFPASALPPNRDLKVLDSANVTTYKEIFAGLLEGAAVVDNGADGGTV